MHRKDRAKGEGGVIAYISSNLPSKKLKLPENFSAIEALAIQSKLGRHNALLLGLYRSPKATGKDYYLRLENAERTTHCHRRFEPEQIKIWQ